MHSTESEQRCSRETVWGRCEQTTTHVSGLCSAHLRWELTSTQPDPYYHEKIVRGLTTPTWDWMSEHEAHAVINGRYRGDARRLDQWVTGDPVGIDVSAFEL